MYDLVNRANALIQSEPEQALGLIEQALRRAYQYKNTRGEAYAQNSLGAINIQLERYEVALEHLQVALNLFERMQDSAGLYSVSQSLAIAHDALGQNEPATVYYQRWLAMARSDFDRIDDASLALSRLGALAAQAGAYQAALDQLEEALALAESVRDTALQVRIYNDLGAACEAAGQTDRALDAFQTATELAQAQPGRVGEDKRSSQGLIPPTPEQKQSAYEPRLNRQIGELYLQRNQSEAAIPYLKRSIDLAEPLGELSEQTEAYQQLAQAYEQMGDYSLALQSYRNAATLADSVQLQKERGLTETQRLAVTLRGRDQRIALMKKDQELQDERIARLEQERATQQAELQQQRLLVYGLLILLLLALVAGLLVMRAYRARQRSNQRLALKSLRSQLNPHFLFNSLNSINSFISQQNERAANKYLADFARLMRAVLEHSQEDWVPLSTELEMLQLYLRLEHVRFADQFEYTLEVDPGLDADQVEVPPLLIQPYVENAIWHGLRYKAKPGHLRVSLMREPKALRITISDDGIGRERSQALKTKNQRSQQSTGLRNNTQRLALLQSLYGRQLRVSIQALQPEAEEPGTRVEIEVPLSSLETDSET